MKSTIPNVLYTYKAINTNIYHQILNGYLWPCPPTEFNDTFDCALNYKIIPLIIDFIRKEAAKSGARKITEVNEQEIIQDVISKQHIVSFTNKCDNPTMWSHYANKYEGICIGWKVKNIKQKIHKVKYENDLYGMLSRHEEDTISIPSQSKKCTIFESIARLKLDTWKYESKFRYIAVASEKFNHEVPCPIESITFGLKTRENEKDIIRYLATTGENANSKIKLYQLKQNNKKLTLSRLRLPD